MNPLARLKQMRKAHRLYDALIQGDTNLLVEYFPFVKIVFTPKITPAPPLRKPLAPPVITYQPHSEADDLRDALDIGFSELNFDHLEDEDHS